MTAVAVLGLVLVAVFAAALFVPRLLHPGREPGEAGTAAVSPQRPPAAGGMAVPARAPLRPAVTATQPFAYDNGLIIGDET